MIIRNKNSGNRLIIFAVLLCIMFISIPLFGANYYVASTGSDRNPGTKARPWQTVKKAAITLVAGDTVLIREGR